MPPFDFVIRGVPRSVNAASSSLKRWKCTVSKAAKSFWPGEIELLQGELSVRIVFYFSGQTSIDVDNIIKPIVDSLKGIVFEDDRIVFEVTCRKTMQGPDTRISGAPACLLTALGTIPDFVFVRVENGPNHAELPS